MKRIGLRFVVAMAVGCTAASAFAQTGLRYSGAVQPVAYESMSYYADGNGTATATDKSAPPTPPAATPAAPAAPAAAAPDAPTAGTGCSAATAYCDCCDGGCNQQCDCDCGCVFDWSKNTWVKVGAGLRVSYDNIEQHTLTDHKYSFFNPDDARIYLSGQGHEYIKFTLNTEIDNGGTFVSPDDFANIRLLDGIVQFEIDDLLNFWTGRLLPPSDQANLDGPFYQTPYLYPFVSNYPADLRRPRRRRGYWGRWAVAWSNGPSVRLTALAATTSRRLRTLA